MTVSPTATVRAASLTQRSHGFHVSLLHPPRPLVGVSIRMERGCQQNDSLADGYRNLHGVVPVRVHADLGGDVLKGTQPEVIGAI